MNGLKLFMLNMVVQISSLTKKIPHIPSHGSVCLATGNFFALG